MNIKIAQEIRELVNSLEIKENILKKIKTTKNLEDFNRLGDDFDEQILDIFEEHFDKFKVLFMKILENDIKKRVQNINLIKVLRRS